VFEDENGVARHIGFDTGPVDWQALNSEEEHERIAIPAHVGRRALVCAVDIFQIADQRRGTGGGGGAATERSGSGIFHDGKLELAVARLDLRLYYKSGRGFVASLTIPVDDHASDPTRQHVGDLRFDLCRIG